MSYKYTPDGKKVAIIGTLNSKETIVQEIFVSDGTEFPAGEHFLVKTLLDSPAETYQTKQKRQLEQDLAALKTEKEMLKSEILNFRNAAYAAASAKIKWIEQISENEVKEIFEHIKSILCGEYSHVVFKFYNGYEIREWNADLFSISENGKFDSIRLVSLFGFWNGRLKMDWRVNRYSDGSGSDTTFYPFKSLSDAIEYCKKEIYAKEKLSDSDYNFCIKHSIAIDKEKNAERIRLKTEDKEIAIVKARQQLERLETELSAIKQSS